MLGTTKIPSKIIKTEKLDLLMELLRENEGRVIIWCYYIPTVKLLAAFLSENKFSVSVYTGELSDKQREQALKKFAVEENGILVATIQSCGKGTNLQYCNTAIFYEYGYVPTELEQAEDRIYRIGQTQPVTIYYLYGRNTVEEKLIEMHRRKRTTNKAILPK